MTTATIKGVQRQTSDAEVNVGVEINRGLLVAQSLPPFAEHQRRGDGWTVGTATLFAPIVAFPTTTAQLEVYNNGRRTMIISSLYASQIVGPTVQEAAGIFAMVSTQKAVPTLTALNVYSMSGKAIVVPTASSELVTGVGTTVVANGWRPWGPPISFGLGAAPPGSHWSAEIDGRIIVPPLCSLCMHIVASVATASAFQCGFSFAWDTMTVDA